ncbi:hypothetical protein DMENIID0001_013020 [Sergentomyia squamirostris]
MRCILEACPSKSKTLLHRFPSDKQLKDAWFKSISKQKLVPIHCESNMYICELHFRACDMVKSDNRKSKASLKPGAIPKCFTRTSFERQEKSVKRRSILMNIPDFEHFRENFMTCCTASIVNVYSIRITDEFVSFYKIGFSDVGKPIIKVNIAVSDNLGVQVYIDEEIIYPNNLCWAIPKGGRLTNFAQLDILLRYYKDGNQILVKNKDNSRYVENLDMTAFFMDYLLIECESQLDEERLRLCKLLGLLQNQVNLLNGQHYSEELIEFSKKLYAISPDAYEVCKKLLNFPNEGYLIDITQEN